MTRREQRTQVSQLIIGGQTITGDRGKDLDVLAQELRDLHTDRRELRREVGTD